MVKGFGRRPLAGRSCGIGGPAFESLPRRKPRGGRGCLLARRYGDLWIGGGSRASEGGAATRSFVEETDERHPL